MFWQSTEDPNRPKGLKRPLWNLVRLLWGCCLAGGLLAWIVPPATGAVAAPKAGAALATTDSLISGSSALSSPSGFGTAVVSPDTAAASSNTTLTFTCTAGSGSSADGVELIEVKVHNFQPSDMLQITDSNIPTPTAPGNANFFVGRTSDKSSPETVPVAVCGRGVRPQVVTAATPAITPSSPASPTGKPKVQRAAAGTMTVSPSSVAAARPSTLTFTFTASRAGLRPSGVVALTVPRGWTTPTPKPGIPGYTSTSTGTVLASGRRIRITGAKLAPRHSLTIVYHRATAPPHPGPWEFRARAGSSRTAGAARLTTSLTVLVTAAAVRTSSQLTAPWFTALVVIPGALFAAAAWLLQRRGRLARPASVAAISGRAVPGMTTVRDLGPQEPLIVRIEPHADSVSIRTEEVKR